MSFHPDSDDAGRRAEKAGRVRGVDPSFESALSRAELATQTARQSGGNKVIQR